MKIAFTLARSPLFWVGGFVLISSVVSNLVNGQSNMPNTQSATIKISREGTSVSAPNALCRVKGDRLTIELASGEQPLIALENLAAQRVLEAISVDPGDSNWSVNGRLTEFQGKNYLLLERVGRGAAASSAAP